MFWKCYLISYSKQNKQGQGAGCQDAQIAPGPPSLYQNIDNDRTHLHSRPCRPSGRCGVGHGAINCKTINDISPLASKLSILIQFVLYSCWLGADIQFGSTFDFNFDWKCVWKWIRSNSFLSFCPRWQNVTMMFYSEKWMIVTKRRSVQRSALGGGQGGGSFFISRLGEMWLWQAGARPQWCWPYIGHRWMEPSYTIAIQLLFCRFTQKFNICSCHQQRSPPPPAQPSQLIHFWAAHKIRC